MPESAAASPPTPPRREAILDAALVEFNAKGVAGTSISDLCRRSGASVGSIYHHFGDKEGIAGALHLEGLIDYQEGFLATLTSAVGARDGIERGVRHHVQWTVRHAELARFMLLGRDAGMTLATERPLTELGRRFFGAVQRWVTPFVQNGEIRDVGPELLTALWIGPSQELGRHWLAGRTRVNPADAAPVLAEAAWRSVRLGREA